jgi:hypothetical protein
MEILVAEDEEELSKSVVSLQAQLFGFWHVLLLHWLDYRQLHCLNYWNNAYISRWQVQDLHWVFMILNCRKISSKSFDNHICRFNIPGGEGLE